MRHFVAGCLLGIASYTMAQSNYGTPTILRFPGGAKAAISLQFDDSMTTQLANALPVLKSHGLHATFFVNTESSQYKQHQHEWEVDVLKAGHDLGNHTSHHKGATTIDELEKEIGDCSAQLEKVYGPAPRLISFAIPGGVPWDFKPEQLNPILRKHHLVLAEHRNFFEDAKTDPITFVKKAIDNGWASNVSMHGVGGEWLSTSIPTLTKLLDFLVEHKAEVWVAPEIEIYKYGQEREAAATPSLTPTDSGFNLAVNCEPTKLAFRDYAAMSIYNQPLTVEVEVPTGWRTVSVTQGHHRWQGPVVVRQGKRFAQCPVLPNAGTAFVSGEPGQ